MPIMLIAVWNLSVRSINQCQGPGRPLNQETGSQVVRNTNPLKSVIFIRVLKLYLSICEGIAECARLQHSRTDEDFVERTDHWQNTNKRFESVGERCEATVGTLNGRERNTARFSKFTLSTAVLSRSMFNIIKHCNQVPGCCWCLVPHSYENVWSSIDGFSVKHQLDGRG